MVKMKRFSQKRCKDTHFSRHPAKNFSREGGALRMKKKEPNGWLHNNIPSDIKIATQFGWLL
jgi:hypothetical protein